ncbi:MAG TPA: D-alanine--D-alanine ligase [Candidatus Limivivens intestinipullorum]|mgnify:CR=1 FL=1|uniref:D-alanine--D-alanine ligase n=1 Tax=Candidatus Limivivens intestinipullorum TaxID=2840858 RepID=A0A9D1JLS7_9FIRM|nr:D-alanine--D-alanine ligase [Candidatus Limivivens intestinipullorum]
MNIVVLAGGTSTEREISIVSGTQICIALRGRGHRAVLVDIYSGDRRLMEGERFPEAYDVEEAAAYIRGFDQAIRENYDPSRPFFGPGVLELCQSADIVFMALHGSNGEDGKVQAVFDLLRIPYTGSGPLGSAMAMDKGISKQLFRQSGLPTPEGFVLRKEEKDRSLESRSLCLPCVVKPCCGGSSVGVSIAHTREEYEKALDDAFSYEDELVVERYIRGREFSVGVVDGEAYPIIELEPIQGFYDYHNKYAAGSTIETCPAKLSDSLTGQMQEYACLAYRILRLEKYARIDFMMDEKEEIYCLEANTLPGMTPTSLLPQEAAALGMSFGDLCEKLIQVSLSDYKKTGAQV